ncbi:neural cell adhesion molecule 2-like isoform X2 [Anneissia japonica]|uniref:neural cell adhesion molecule 2-like isoform X2 n=1 Tax=Anneissia japonica TaxID=1529436 RepID=UPI00142567A4|nr:neural cell adhesion molecule 2-like isoform X2 [Anneissia japonica]
MTKVVDQCRLLVIISLLLTSIRGAVALTELTEGSSSYTVSDKCTKAAGTSEDAKSVKTRCVELTEQLQVYKQEKINSNLELDYEPTVRTSTETSNNSAITPFVTTINVFSKGCRESPCPPMEITVATGESAMLYCTMPTRNSVAAWIHQTTTDNVELLTSDNQLISTRRDIQLDYDATNGLYNLILRSISAYDAGNYSCQIDNRHTSKISVDVLVPGKIIQIEPLSPRVLGSKDPNERYFKELQDVVLFCIADGKPSPTVTWYRTNLLQDLNDTRFKDCGQGVARIWNVKVEDTGDYVCTATNHLNEADGDKQIIKLIVKYKPRLKTSRKHIRSAVGNHVCMACYIDALPVADTVTWLQNATVLSNDRGILINVDERRTRFCILQITSSHYGNYTCRATNEVGTTDAQVVLSGTPIMPTIVGSSVGEWPNRYLLRWRASRKGEESNGNTIPINGFIIKYQYIWDTGEGQQVVKRISKDIVTFKSFVYGYYIENLHPDWSYKITVTTFNDFGESDESIPMYFITAIQQTQEHRRKRTRPLTNQDEEFALKLEIQPLCHHRVLTCVRLQTSSSLLYV